MRHENQITRCSVCGKRIKQQRVYSSFWLGGSWTVICIGCKDKKHVKQFLGEEYDMETNKGKILA